MPLLVQSSCTSPYLEVESAYMQNMQGLSNLNGRSTSDLNNEEMEKLDECMKLEKGSVMLESNARGMSISYVSHFKFFQVFSFIMVK